MVEEEEAVEPGSKKRKVCSSVQNPPMRPCARVPVPCQVCWPCETHVCSRCVCEGRLMKCGVGKSRDGMHGWQQGVRK